MDAPHGQEFRGIRPSEPSRQPGAEQTSDPWQASSHHGALPGSDLAAAHVVLQDPAGDVTLHAGEQLCLGGLDSNLAVGQDQGPVGPASSPLLKVLRGDTTLTPGLLMASTPQ